MDIHSICIHMFTYVSNVHVCNTRSAIQTYALLHRHVVSTCAYTHIVPNRPKKSLDVHHATKKSVTYPTSVKDRPRNMKCGWQKPLSQQCWAPQLSKEDRCRQQSCHQCRRILTTLTHRPGEMKHEIANGTKRPMCRNGPRKQ